MTSKLKCPMCQTELEQMHNRKILGCPKCLHIADGAFWVKAIQAIQDLEIARQALSEIYVKTGDVRAKITIEQIDHIADASKMVEHKD